MQTIGLYPNLLKKNLINVAKDLIKWFREHDYSVLLPKNVARFIEMPHLATDTNSLIENRYGRYIRW